MTITSRTPSTGDYRLDPVHTGLGFVARDIMGPKVRRVFETFQGRVHLDFADLERSSAEALVDVANDDTDSLRRDRHLSTSDFLDAASHPQIVFRSTAVHPIGEDRHRLTGELTIRGRTRPVMIDPAHTGAAEETDSRCRATVEGRASVGHKHWGITGGGRARRRHDHARARAGHRQDRRPPLTRH